MKKLNKKGFTLVELLAVIVILAVIMVITIPTVLGSMDKATDSAFESAVSTMEDYVNKNYELCKLGGVLSDEYDDTLFDINNDCALKVDVDGPTDSKFSVKENDLALTTFLNNTNYSNEFSEVYINVKVVQYEGESTTDVADDKYRVELANAKAEIVAKGSDDGQFKGKKSTGIPVDYSTNTYFGGTQSDKDVLPVVKRTVAKDTAVYINFKK